ncbi:hypothetical protein [Cupriavidus necator]|uniref:hypothetical protein n=1 Tax=Cupriavidus necator TaxID=106590 RepID=UPI00339D7ECC
MLNERQRAALCDAMHAAQSRLAVPAETEEQRQACRTEMRERLDDAVLALLDAERAACRAGDSALADRMAKVRWAVKGLA